MIDLSKHKHIHLVGIGGIGVSAIGEILYKKGYQVSGSDMHASDITRRLEEKGIRIHYEHKAENVTGSDLVVYTAAASSDNPELVRAAELGITCISRAEMLGLLMDSYKNSIAISGVHGKTTTTSMLSLILTHNQSDPTLLIGGEVSELGGNARFGDSDLFVTEACEYKESFLNFRPYTAAILNIDEDHLDYFRDLNHIIEAFTRFTGNIHPQGHLVANGDDYNIQKILSHAKCKVVTFGINKPADFKAVNITYEATGFPTFSVEHQGKIIATLSMIIPGTHNIYNALAAFAMASVHGVPAEVIVSTLSTFTGAKRRFDRLGTYNGAMVIDDYAHHPSEVRATLSAALKIPHREVVCVFQPHTYTRTKELLSEFSTAFKDADQLIILDIYAAREQDPGNIHARDLVARIADEGQKALYMGSFAEATEYLKEHLKKDDILFTMGAGNVCDIGKSLVALNK